MAFSSIKKGGGDANYSISSKANQGLNAAVNCDIDLGSIQNVQKIIALATQRRNDNQSITVTVTYGTTSYTTTTAGTFTVGSATAETREYTINAAARYIRVASGMAAWTGNGAVVIYTA